MNADQLEASNSDQTQEIQVRNPMQNDPFHTELSHQLPQNKLLEKTTKKAENFIDLFVHL